MVDTPTNTAVVPIKSAWSSKINWVQAVSALSMVLTLVSGGQLNITPDQQAAIIVVIGIATNIITWILRTWFNGTVNPASLPSSNING